MHRHCHVFSPKAACTFDTNASEFIVAEVLAGRCQQLAAEIRTLAEGARSKRVHPIRVRHAVECGRALAGLKKLLGDGHWGDWVKAQCGLTRMTANRYMRLASRAHLVTPHMTIREAYVAGRCDQAVRFGRNTALA